MSQRDNEVYLVGEITCPEGKDEDNGSFSAYRVGQAIAYKHSILPPSEPLILKISSSGGSMEAALYLQGIINTIRREGRIVISHILGYAMSSAFDIVQCCDERWAEPNAELMQHEVQMTLPEMSSGAIHITSEYSRKVDLGRFSLLAARTGKPIQYYIDKLHSKEWYLTAAEALEEGMIDKILPFTPFKKLEQAPKPTRRSKKLTD
jgi:ATP-dependent protease ClpP protease subunit